MVVFFPPFQEGFHSALLLTGAASAWSRRDASNPEGAQQQAGREGPALGWVCSELRAWLSTSDASQP